jgi:hypothetical protein
MNSSTCARVMLLADPALTSSRPNLAVSGGSASRSSTRDWSFLWSRAVAWRPSRSESSYDADRRFASESVLSSALRRLVLELLASIDPRTIRSPIVRSVGDGCADEGPPTMTTKIANTAAMSFICQASHSDEPQCILLAYRTQPFELAGVIHSGASSKELSWRPRCSPFDSAVIESDAHVLSLVASRFSPVRRRRHVGVRQSILHGRLET